jgi:hypothetical protein
MMLVSVLRLELTVCDVEMLAIMKVFRVIFFLEHFLG